MPNSHHHDDHDDHDGHRRCPNGRGPNVFVRDMVQRSMLLLSMILQIILQAK